MQLGAGQHGQSQSGSVGAVSSGEAAAAEVTQETRLASLTDRFLPRNRRPWVGRGRDGEL